MTLEELAELHPAEFAQLREAQRMKETTGATGADEVKGASERGEDVPSEAGVGVPSEASGENAR